MAEEIRKINGVELCVESFGSPDDPCILLIMGAMASMVWWDSEFCLRLAKQGRFVIRYDNRDVGRSTCYPPGESHYSFHDLVDDSVAVLDSFGIRKARFAGMSLGGMIAQAAALRYADRVLSFIAIASGNFDDRPELPPVSEKILVYHAGAAKVDWGNARQVKDYLVGGWRLLNGTRHAFDENQAMALADGEMRRARSLLSMFNHARLTGGEELYGKGNELRLSTVVIMAPRTRPAISARESHCRCDTRRSTYHPGRRRS